MTSESKPSVEPDEAVGHVVTFQDGDREITLLGTAHVSEASVKEVRDFIDSYRPDTVAVELDQGRYDALLDESRWRKLDIFKVLKQRKFLFLLVSLYLSSYQRRLGEKFGVKPGSELLEAIKAGREAGSEIVLIDRDINTTLRRTAASISWWQRISLLSQGLVELVGGSDDGPSEEEIEELKQGNNISSMLAMLTEHLPSVKRPLVDERDRYMVSGIRDAPGKRVLAVVGALHVPGMKESWNETIDRTELAQDPPPSMLMRVLKWVIPVIILAAFAIGWQRQQGQGLQDMLYAWVLPNSVLCALFTAAAGAKFLSIVTGFIASPITSLNPLLPAGVVVGLVEAWLRRPTVEDAERIPDDTQTFKGLFRNSFTRVLIVAAFATLGSAAGAWVGLGWLFSLLS